MMSREAKLRSIASGWDAASSLYDEKLAPLFEPWVRRSVDALGASLPPGVIYAPCCGTGADLELLAERYPHREIIGVDLSPKMVERARARCKDLLNVKCQAADASLVEDWPPSAAVVSTFGLQQMPEPAVAVGAWMRSLAKDGVLSVVYWPKSKEDEGPFVWLGKALRGRIPSSDHEWEGALYEVIEAAGGRVTSDERATYPMRHPNAEAFWQALTEAGPLRQLALAKGAEFMAEVHADFVKHAGEAANGPIVHHPVARHIVARRSRG